VTPGEFRTYPAGPPAGFPRCRRCPYVRVGPAHLCVACAGRTLEVIADAACVICSQALEPDGACPNWLCADPRRRIAKIHAIAYQSGPLKRVIGRYKYDEKYGWAAIFGRLVLGWLEQNAAQDPPDLIVANPTYTGAGGRRRPHTEQVLEAAAKEDKGGRWLLTSPIRARSLKLRQQSGPLPRPLRPNERPLRPYVLRSVSPTRRRLHVSGFWSTTTSARQRASSTP
jgi:predicted amidophosphoribosyltransferase